MVVKMILRIQKSEEQQNILKALHHYYNLLFYLYVIPDPLWVVSLGLFDPELCDLSVVVTRLYGGGGA